MSDIVARLNAEHDLRLTFGQDWSDLLLAAASEIKRLRARVAELEAELIGVKKDLEWERNPGQNGY